MINSLTFSVTIVKIVLKMYQSEQCLAAGLGHNEKIKKLNPGDLTNKVKFLIKQAISGRCEAKPLGRKRFFL